jgi:hypothetical protein
MPAEVTIGGNDDLFIGEDKTLRFELWDETDPTKSIDMAGWVMVFDVRIKDTSPDPAILSKTPTLSGTFNVTRTLNLQRAFVSLSDDDTNLFLGGKGKKTYRWSWKRMDANGETVLGRGDFTPKKATAP